MKETAELRCCFAQQARRISHCSPQRGGKNLTQSFPEIEGVVREEGSKEYEEKKRLPSLE